MPTPGERGPTPKRFPGTKGKAAIPVKSLPVSIEPETSIPVKSLPVHTGKKLTPKVLRKGVSKARKRVASGPPLLPSRTSEQPPASATLRLAATANGAPRLPSASNGNNINGEGNGMAGFP